MGNGPAAPAGESPALAVKGATVHTLVGAPITQGVVIIRDGHIAAVGKDITIPKGAQVIDVSGLHLYPGFFDSMSQLGLVEVGSIDETNDTTDIGDFNPQLVAASAIYPASEIIPVTRANGVTHTLSSPGSGGGFRRAAPIVPGQASLISLAGWTVEEMMVASSAGLIVNWPRIETRTFDFSTFSMQEAPFKEARNSYQKKLAELTDWFEAAQHYAQAVERGSKDQFERDLKLESMIPIVKGKTPILVIAQEVRQIKDALAFAEKFDLRLVLAGAAESWKIKELLAEKKIPVILGQTQVLPREEDDPYDKPFTTATELFRAGVLIAFATFGASDSRTLPYEAGNAVAYGLPWEEGIKAITLNPARILGVEDRLGSIEAGKIANLIVTDGDPLEIRTEIKHLFINGKSTSLDNKHRRLYERYRERN